MAEGILPDDRLTLIVEDVRIEASAWEVPPFRRVPERSEVQISGA
jgi:hypothetical protein